MIILNLFCFIILSWEANIGKNQSWDCIDLKGVY